MRTPEPDPGNPRKVTTVILTDREMEIIHLALVLYEQEFELSPVADEARALIKSPFTDLKGMKP